MRYHYEHGNPNSICDRSGFKVKKSTTRKEWNGLTVRDKDWEARHPQDYVRGREDRQSVHEPRPESANTFLTVNEAASQDF